MSRINEFDKTYVFRYDKNVMNDTMTYTASEARKKLYRLIRQASRGLRSYEIKLRGSDPVVLMSKAELESWQETLDILSNPKEAKTLKKAMKETSAIAHNDMLKAIGLTDET